MDYRIKHIAMGHFKVYLEDGTEKEVGENLRGIIKYTYFEESPEYPPIGWEINNLTLLKDYNSRLFADMQSGKLQKDIESGKINLS